MVVLWILFIGSLVILPGTAALALRWSVRNGEMRNFQKIALSIFDEDEPVGQMTDHFPSRKRDLSASARRTPCKHEC
jgi:hypothetical protein